MPESKRVLMAFSKRAVERWVAQSGPLKTVRRYSALRLLELGPDGGAAQVLGDLAPLEHAAVARHEGDRADAVVLRQDTPLEALVLGRVHHLNGDARRAGHANRAVALDGGLEGAALVDVGLGLARFTGERLGACLVACAQLVLALLVVGLPVDGVRGARAEGALKLRLGQPVGRGIADAVPLGPSRDAGVRVADLEYTAEHG